jgi:two-component system nitrogen regulation sensor histidine kinase NtrY
MHFAEHIAGGIGKHLAGSGNSVEGLQKNLPTKWLEGFLGSQRELLALDAVEFYSDPFDERLISSRVSDPSLAHGYPRLSLDLLERAFSGEHVPVVQHVGSGDLIRCLVPVRLGASGKGQIQGVLAVSDYIPVSLVNKVDEIASVFDDYKDTNPLKYPMKTTYLVILIMITLVILFVAIWIGLYMARELTVPVERLVYGAQEVGAGNLDVSIISSGHDEITVLVESFNKMTHDLRESRTRLIQAGADLEKRRLQLEAVLGNIGTGVIAVDSRGEITTFNPSAARLLQMDSDAVLSRPYREILRGEALPLVEMIDRALADVEARDSRLMTAPEIAQVSFRLGENVKMLAVMTTPLRESETNWGVVMVIDDMTHLVKAQREMAWREVARRIAHEIKNPLTPIKLSAQRLQRRMGNYRGRDAELLQECTDTIIKHADELKEMVNEFSNFARFPEVSPTPNDLHEALLEVVKLFSQAHTKIQFKVEQDSRLPIFEFDRDQIKRVLINLLDNGVAALTAHAENRNRMINLRTHYNEQLQMAAVEVSDNGPGMADEVRERVFEPYFSTKKEGTGLGLAIAKRIVNDHDGFIRVHSVPGEGTRFLIELPTAVRHETGGRRSRPGSPLPE